MRTSLLLLALVEASGLVACTAPLPEETNLARNAGAPSPATGGSGGPAASAGGHGGAAPKQGSVGTGCASDEECTSYDAPSCLHELKPLAGKILDPMNPTAGKFENELVLPFPGGYCATTIAHSCASDAACGEGGGCFRALAGVDKVQLQVLDDSRTCATSSTGGNNPGLSPNGTSCKTDGECAGAYCTTLLPFSVVQFADVGICLRPCQSNDECRQSDGYACAVPMAPLLKIINPKYGATYCVGPFTFML